MEELIAADGPAPIGCIAFLCISCKAERSETLRCHAGDEENLRGSADEGGRRLQGVI